MGNCFSLSSNSPDVIDEEKNELIPETISASQEAALAVANERLRAGEEELLTSREGMSRLQDALHQAEEGCTVLRAERDERLSELSVTQGQLVTAKDALQATIGEVSRLDDEGRRLNSELDARGKQLRDSEGALQEAKEENDGL